MGVRKMAALALARKWLRLAAKKKKKKRKKHEEKGYHGKDF